jgi:hypothetical protein
MQLTPINLKEMLSTDKMELELTRESLIDKISMLAVTYFCTSTEIRFIIQLKENPELDFDKLSTEA